MELSAVTREPCNRFQLSLSHRNIARPRRHNDVMDVAGAANDLLKKSMLAKSKVPDGNIANGSVEVLS